MTTSISVKIPDKLLAHIEHTRKKTELSRHATILELIRLGLSSSATNNRFAQQKMILEENVKVAWKDGVFTGACYTIAIIAVLLLALLTAIKIWY